MAALASALKYASNIYKLKLLYKRLLYTRAFPFKISVNLQSD